jgi:hypothetical protein
VNELINSTFGQDDTHLDPSSRILGNNSKGLKHDKRRENALEKQSTFPCELYWTYLSKSKIKSCFGKLQ